MGELVNEISRKQVIVRTSIIGIIANVFLAAFKAAIGFMSNSIAIMLDAVNNISDAWHGSVHIEVPDTYGASQIDKLSREIIVEVKHKHNVLLTAIGVYSYNTQDEEILKIENKLRDIVFANQFVRQIHGFYVVPKNKTMRFDLVISFEAEDRNAVFREVVDLVQKEFSDYELQAVIDTDFAEE